MRKNQDRYENDGSEVLAIAFILLVTLASSVIFWLRLTDGRMY